MKKLLFPLVSLLLFIACQKTPTAAFTTDKLTYTAGETVHLTNTTTNGSSYVWTFPDGTTSSETNAEYALNSTLPSESITFTLKASSKNGKKTNTVSHDINVQASIPSGTLTFWQCTTCSANFPIKVTISTGSANISLPYASAPSCNAIGCASFNGIATGTYSYSAFDGINTFTGTVNVTQNNCIVQKI